MQRVTGKFWNDESVLNHDCGGSYVTAYTCKNSSNETLKMGEFNDIKIIPCSGLNYVSKKGKSKF